MSNSDDPKSKPALTPKQAVALAERERRLAEALRANLKRRKEQTRGRVQGRATPSGGNEEK